MQLIGPIGPSYIDIDCMTFAADGFLYGVDTHGTGGTALWRIDPATGHRTNVAALPAAVNGLYAGRILGLPLPPPQKQSAEPAGGTGGAGGELPKKG